MKIKKVFIILLIGIINYPIFSQNLSWIKQISGTGDAVPYMAKVDNSNNIYIIGYFTTQLKQGGITLNSYGLNDGFIAKFDNSGSLLWVKQIGGIGTEGLTGISLSNDGNYIYVAGNFQYTCKFSATDSLTVTGLQNATTVNGFIAKYALNGTLQSKAKIVWGRTGYSDRQRIRGLGVDKNGKLLIFGNFENKLYFANDSITGIAGFQNYIAKINEDGTIISKKLISGTDATANTLIYTMDVCNDAYYWAGYYSKNLTFDLGTITSNGGTVDMFVYKTDFNLTGQWIRKISGAGTEYCSSISCDSLNDIYIGGYFNTTSPGITIDSTGTTTCAQHPITHGGFDIFYAKYQPNGNLDWYHNTGSAGASPNNDDEIFRALYGSGVFMVAGKFGGNFTYYNHNLTYTGGTGTDVLGIVHDNKDNLVYAIGFGGTANDIGETSAIDNLGNYYFIGDFASASLTVGGTTLTNGGGRDLFITKYMKGSLNKVSTNVLCKGQSTGSIVVTPYGPLSTPYTYSWTEAGNGSFSSNNDSLFNLSAGTYRVHFTDGVGFSINDSVIITEPATATSISVDSTRNVYCYNDTSGRIYIKVQGGTIPYAYQWQTSNGGGLNATVEDQLHVTAGTYSVYVTDGNNCVDSLKNITITQPASKISITSAVVSPINGPAGDGAVNITVSGGTPYVPGPSYQFLWTGPFGYTSSSQDISSLANSGNYSVIASDKLGCTADTTVLVPDTSHLFVKVVSQNNVSCHGGSDGSATVQAVNAKGGIVITWTPGNMHTATVSGLTAQTYTVTIADLGRLAPDSIATTNVIITQPATALNAGFSVSNVTCYGIYNGSITLTVTGGTIPYSYQWTKDGVSYATTEDLANLSPATYAYTVTDAKGCSVSGSTPVTSPTQISIVSASIVDQTCNQGRNDGSVTLQTVSGGTPYTGNKYYYTWSNGVSGLNVNSITLLSPSNYGVIIKDASNCTINGLFTVNAGSSIGGSITKQDVTCYNASDGQATMNPSFQGGRSLRSYLWTTSNMDTTQTVLNLSPGSYTVDVTDNKGCEAYFNTSIANKTALSLTENLASHINVTCHGGSNGQLGVTATGGTGLYEYQLNGDGWGTSEIFSNLFAGNYKVVLRDRTYPTCQYSGLDSISITQPAPLVVNLSASPGNIVCTGTSVTFTATAGLSNYDFKIGGITVQSGASNTFVTSALITGNIVTVTGTDASGCSNTSLGIIMTVNPLPTASLAGTASICIGDSTMLSITLTGTSPWNVTYTDGTTPTTVNNIGASPYTFYVHPVVNTTYNVTEVSDAKCTGTSFGSSATITINQLPSITGQPADTNICLLQNANFAVTATGTGLVYQWQLSTNGGATWANQSSGGVYSGMTTATMTINGATLSLNGYQYRCVVSGTCNPADTSSAAILSVTAPPAITIQPSNSAVCEFLVPGFKISATGTGITYQWQLSTNGGVSWADQADGGVYTGMTTDSMTILDAPLSMNGYRYRCVVSNSCAPAATSNAATLTVYAYPVVTLSCSDADRIICDGTSVTFTAVAGLSNYNFMLNDSTVQNGISNKYKTDSLNDNDAVTVTGTNSHGCSSTSLAVTMTVNPNPSVVASIVHQVSCNGAGDGIARAVASGGTAPYTYSWNTVPVQTKDTAYNLTPGKYIISVKDVNSCGPAKDSIVITQLPPLNLTEVLANHKNVKCNGDHSGSFKVAATGGSGNYEYAVNSLTNWVSSPLFQNDSAGSYKVIVRDSNATTCIYGGLDSIAITEPPAIKANIIVHDISCYGKNDGMAVAQVSGGTGALHLLWDDPSSSITNTISNLSPATYHLSITDDSSCNKIFPATISQPDSFWLSISSIPNVKCNGDSTGVINISATGGRLPYSFNWSNGSITQNLDSVPAGNYIVNATDSSGCAATLSTYITEATPINALIVSDTIKCHGDSTGTAIATTSGGYGTLHPAWNDPLNTHSDTLSNVYAGNYLLTVVDDSSCMKLFPVTITQLDSLYLSEDIADHINAICNGTASGSCTLTASGGSGTFEFTSDSTTWTTDSVFTGLDAGMHKFILRDKNYPGCYYNKLNSILITEPPPLTVSKPVVTYTSGWNANDGTISVIGSGGPGQINYTLYPGDISNTTGIFTVGTGNYMIIVYDDLGCDTLQSEITYVGPWPETIAKSSLSIMLNIYPNPNEGIFNIEYVDPNSDKMLVEVFNVLGIKVFIKEFSFKIADSFNEVIDLRSNPKGIYFIRINNRTFKDGIIIK